MGEEVNDELYREEHGEDQVQLARREEQEKGRKADKREGRQAGI